MTDEASLESQVTYLYNASAKGLYNLALYSIGDQRLAEQLAIDAFASAYNRLSDKTDVTRFRIKSTRQLYRIIKKTLINHSKYSFHEQDTHEDAKFISNKGQNRLYSLLTGLCYNERFLLLLFLQQRFSAEQVAQILYAPQFIIKKRFCRMISKAMIVWDKLKSCPVKATFYSEN